MILCTYERCWTNSDESFWFPRTLVHVVNLLVAWCCMVCVVCYVLCGVCTMLCITVKISLFLWTEYRWSLSGFAPKVFLSRLHKSGDLKTHFWGEPWKSFCEWCRAKIFIGLLLEMCLERKYKKREWERNGKERFSFLSHSSIFWHPFSHFWPKSWKTGEKRGGTEKNDLKDVERGYGAVLPLFRFSNLARFRFLYHLKHVFAPFKTCSWHRSNAILAPFQTRS